MKNEEKKCFACEVIERIGYAASPHTCESPTPTNSINGGTCNKCGEKNITITGVSTKNIHRCPTKQEGSWEEEFSQFSDVYKLTPHFRSWIRNLLSTTLSTLKEQISQMKRTKENYHYPIYDIKGEENYNEAIDNVLALIYNFNRRER